MLINLRNALMSGKRLPYDAEVEFLESTGTQWIDTGISSKSTDSIDISFQPTVSSGDVKFFGSLRGFAVGYISNKWRFGFGNWATYEIASDTNAHVVTYSGGTLKLDGTTVTTATIGTNANTYKIFAAINNSGIVLMGSAKFYRVRIWDNGTLVRDYIPVRKGTVGYLYDRVSGKLFGNAGTGDFVLGQDVVPVEYIESNGTQWIDTGVAFADNFKWAVDFNGLDVQKTIFGGRASTTRTSLLYRYSASEVVINIAQHSSTTTPFKLGNIASGRHCVECAINQNVGNVWLDGVQVYTNEVIAGTYISGVSQALFADNFGSYVLEQASSKLYKCQMWQSGTLVRSFLPVRVGTEGAMMDVLTRRIYRNAGTGAFTYGNDLKYPIPAS